MSIEHIVERVRLQAWLGEVSYARWSFDLLESHGQFALRVRWRERDVVTGRRTRLTGRKWLLSPAMTKSEVIQTAFKAVLTAVEHEVRERFRYAGQPIFHPHYDVDALWRLARSGADDLRPARRKA